MATERKQSEIQFKRSRCLASQWENQKLLTVFDVINGSHTTVPTLLSCKTCMSCPHLVLPVECSQYGIPNTLQFGPRLFCHLIIRLSWSVSVIPLIGTFSYSDPKKLVHIHKAWYKVMAVHKSSCPSRKSAWAASLQWFLQSLNSYICRLSLSLCTSSLKN